uniref:Transmembrane protein n=1 Tax=Macrostomum lignano TaxID=282301 RepID=A0A1I8FJB5_9PLAT
DTIPYPGEYGINSRQRHADGVGTQPSSDQLGRYSNETLRSEDQFSSVRSSAGHCPSLRPAAGGLHNIRASEKCSGEIGSEWLNLLSSKFPVIGRRLTDLKCALPHLRTAGKPSSCLKHLPTTALRLLRLWIGVSVVTLCEFGEISLIVASYYIRLVDATPHLALGNRALLWAEEKPALNQKSSQNRLSKRFGFDGHADRIERHEVGQQAALHLERMIALRNSGRATQLEHLELEGPSRDIDEKQCISLPKNGLRISALDEWLPFKPYGLTFLLPLSDAVVQMFSKSSCVKLRKLARLMQCAVELKRSALLRKRRGSAGWVKFAKIFIQGATIKSIMTHANLPNWQSAPPVREPDRNSELSDWRQKFEPKQSAAGSAERVHNENARVWN